MQWKNITSYSQGQTDRTPTTVEMRPAGYRICVTRMHGIPGKWFLRCDAVDGCELKSETLEEAQTEALGIVKTHLSAVLAEL